MLSQNFDLHAKLIALVLLVLEKVQLLGCDSPPRTPNQMEIISARCSSVLLLTLKQKYSGIENLNVKPAYIEKPPMLCLCKPATKMMSSFHSRIILMFITFLVLGITFTYKLISFVTFYVKCVF